MRKCFRLPLLAGGTSQNSLKFQLTISISLAISFTCWCSLSSQSILYSSSYLAYSPAVHQWIQERIDKNSSFSVVKGNLQRPRITDECFYKHRHTEWKIENQQQTINIKYSHSRLFTLEHVHRVGLKTQGCHVLVNYLALVSANDLKNFGSTEGCNKKCEKQNNQGEKIPVSSFHPKLENNNCD